MIVEHPNKFVVNGMKKAAKKKKKSSSTSPCIESSSTFCEKKAYISFKKGTVVCRKCGMYHDK